jgi:hypothetical protein
MPRQRVGRGGFRVKRLYEVDGAGRGGDTEVMGGGDERGDEMPMPEPTQASGRERGENDGVKRRDGADSV